MGGNRGLNNADQATNQQEQYEDHQSKKSLPESSDNNQPQININLDEQQEGDEDLDYLEDIDGIMQYQHKILRKYAMLGMIKYSAVPFFHQLVTSRDYKMICIFEVFAQNRNEDDFLENLGFYSNQRHNLEDLNQNPEQQQASSSHLDIMFPEVNDSPQSIPEPEEPVDPNQALLVEHKEKFEAGEFDFFKEKVSSGDKRTIMMINCYRKNNDLDDMMNSMHRYYKKQKK